MKLSIPSKVVVKELISSRYGDNQRPADWNKRLAGIDLVETDLGKLSLLSDGSQSPPLAGWTIILTDGDERNGYRWTLYALPRIGESCATHSSTSLH